MQGRTCKRYGNKVGMKAHQATLLPNMAKKKGEKDYTTFVAKQCSLPCLSFSPCSVVGQPRVFFIPALFLYFLQVFPYMTFILQKIFYPQFHSFQCFRHITLSCKDWQHSNSGKACCVHMLYSQGCNMLVHDSC